MVRVYIKAPYFSSFLFPASSIVGLGLGLVVGSGTALIFTALYEMQTRSSDENSVCLSVTRVITDKMEERSVPIYIPYERTFILVF